MDKKVLMLAQTIKDDFNLLEWEKNGVDTSVILREHNVILRAVRRYWIKWRLPFQGIWLGSWKHKFADYDMVIFTASWLAEGIPHWMRKQKECPRIIWWYWNSVVEDDHPERVLEEDAEKWSFDPEDCVEYGMRHNSQYYFDSFQVPGDCEIKKDVYYLGSNGGRMQEVLRFAEEANRQGIGLDFNIFEPKEKNWKKVKGLKFFKNSMDYKENLRHIGESKAILEIIRPGQSGQTLRSLEALFHKKKLITNDQNILNKDFYRPENVFVLGKDKIEDLKSFLDTPYEEVDEEIVKYYEAFHWLERFF